MSRKDQQRRWFYSQCLAAKLVARLSTLRCWSERKIWAEIDTCVILWPWTGGDSYGIVFFLFTNWQMRKIYIMCEWIGVMMYDCGWLWYIIDDGTIFNMPRHSMDLGLGYASLQFHRPGCEWSSSSAKDSYQRSLCKGEGQGFKSMSKTVGIVQYHFGDRFWGACLRKEVCVWFVLSFFELLFLVCIKMLGSRNCCENWSKDRKKIEKK